MPWIIHKLIEWIAEYVQGDKTFAEIFGRSILAVWRWADDVAVSGKKSTHEFWKWTGERDNYIIKFFKEVRHIAYSCTDGLEADSLGMGG